METHQKLGAVEADAAQHFHRLLHESNVEDRLGQFHVAEVTGALIHVAGACLAAGAAVDDTLTRVHQATKLRLAALVDLWVADAALGDRHAPNLVRRQDAKLHPLHRPDGRFRVGAERHGDTDVPNPATRSRILTL